MTKRTHPIRSTGSAIAAALALASTPVLAQEIILPPATTPPPVTQAPAPPAPEAPASQPEMVSSPVVQDTPPTIIVPDVPAEPAAAEPESAASVADAPRETAPEPREASVAAPEPAPDTAVAEETVVPPLAAPVAPVVQDASPAPLPATETSEPPSDTSLAVLAILLAAIAIAALTVWGFVAIGRRKHGRARAAIPMVERPVVAEREPAPAAAPAAVTPSDRVTPLASPRPHAPESMAHTGASVALPQRMPESFEERDALLKRMIAARPDRANPFKSPIQRRRRAKLILQSLGRDFGDIEPWIDLSQYPGNWPSAARPASAAA